MDDESNNTAESSALETLRNQARAAILSRRKADARGTLGKLVAMSGEASDRENLDELIRGVGLEAERYIRESSSIQKRLQDGATLVAIQQELDSRIPHWRAFANDLPDLRIARDGLAAHEDPRLKERLKGLERKLADGAVGDVLAEWQELGEPEAAASGALVQVLDAVASLENHIDRQEWPAAKTVLTDARSLLETEEGASFQPGYGDYLKATEDRLRWEILLKRTSSSKDLKGRERQNLLVELSRAESDVNFRLRDTPSLNEIHARLRKAIEDLEVIQVEPKDERTFLRALAVALLVIVLALIAAWLYFRSSGSGGSSAGEPAGTRNPINGEQVTPIFCCIQRHDRINTSNNTYYGLYS
jgi:hypothetical protein